jgi:asparagine synthase (glutamine-hydrolysing)
MCGINGLISFDSITNSSSIIQAMNSAIAHRGPDDSGTYVDQNVALGQVRLSIIDLSSAGKQPMTNASGRYQLVFNGEIYNFKSLKNKLSHYPFVTQTDSEVLLAAYITWGESMLTKLEGMFAFCIYDSEQNICFMARDRFGKKPFYYYHTDKYLIFSSELNGLFASTLLNPTIHKAVLPEYFTYGTLHGNKLLVKDIQMLEPGCSMWVKNKQISSANSYWSFSKNVVSISSNQISKTEAISQTKELFLKSVHKRLEADVPFGAFLSGGIDSSAVTAAMSLVLGKKVNTFNVSFTDKEFSEARFAETIANKYQTKHTCVELSPSVFLEKIDKILDAYDHPSADGANTYIVSEATKNAGLTMALSGLGGDEIFAGYPVFNKLQGLSSKFANIPFLFRKAIAQVLKQVPEYKYIKLADLIQNRNISNEQIYQVFRKITPTSLVKKLCLEGASSSVIKEFLPHLHSISQISEAEFYSYLQPVLLRDTDQMSMRHALEIRAPFLDHELVEFVLSLPNEYKIDHNIPKSLLVNAMGDLLPKEIVFRKKMGFVLPWENWMKNELKQKVENSISTAGDLGLINESFWLKSYREFCLGSKKYNWNTFWSLVTLVHWIRKNNIVCS